MVWLLVYVSTLVLSKCFGSEFAKLLCDEFLTLFLFLFYSTCFNRIDLPMYGSRADLEEKLKLAVTMVATGFDIE